MNYFLKCKREFIGFPVSEKQVIIGYQSQLKKNPYGSSQIIVGLQPWTDCMCVLGHQVCSSVLELIKRMQAVVAPLWALPVHPFTTHWGEEVGSWYHRYQQHSSKVHLEPKAAHNGAILTKRTANARRHKMHISAHSSALTLQKHIAVGTDAQTHRIACFKPTYRYFSEVSSWLVRRLALLIDCKEVSALKYSVSPMSLQAALRSTGALASHASCPNRRRIH